MILLIGGSIGLIRRFATHDKIQVPYNLDYQPLQY